MSTKRVPSTQRKSRRKSVKTRTTARSTAKKAPILFDNTTSARLVHKGMNSVHFIGVCLGGGKTDKTAMALVEYYPGQNKVFLSRLLEKVKSEGEISSDQQIHQWIVDHDKTLHSVAFDVPLTLPKCISCPLECPGYEKCTEPEILWMWNFYRQKSKTTRPVKLFSPYTERSAELYISSELEEEFHPSHALGSNLAPLVARAQYIKRRLKIPLIEVNTKVSLWRIGRSLNIPKSYLRFHRHSFEGEASRRFIMENLIEKDIAFLYVQDVKTMTENNQAFEAFICALTAVLAYKNQIEARPKSFPKDEAWLAIPLAEIKW